MPTLRYSILICTHNRSPVLAKTLELFLAQLGLEPGGELVVVDNASTDATPETVSRFPSIRYVREDRLGLSHARNRAMEVSRGEWLLFVDDDVIPAAGWVSAYRRFSTEASPNCAFVGGRVYPCYEIDPPPELSEGIQYMQGVWGLAEPGNYHDRILGNDSQFPVGANFGGRREEFLKFRFSPDYGRKGQVLRGFEETLFLKSLVESGKHGRWVKGAEVGHLVPEERMTMNYVARLYEGLGHSHWRHYRSHGRFDLMLLCFKYWRRTRGQRYVPDGRRKFRDFTQRYYYLGALKEALSCR